MENKRNAEAFQNAGQIASSKVSFPLEERYQAKIRYICSNKGFVSWNFNPSEISWIGASIGASIRSIEHMSLLRKEFEDK